MKIKYLIIILLLIPILSFSQVSKYRADSYSMKFLNDDGSWGNWMEWMDTGVLTEFDPQLGKITFNLQPQTILDLHGDMEEEVDKEGNTVYKFSSTDQDGKDCQFEILLGKEEEKKIQFYLRYSDMIVVYNVHPLD